MIVAAVELIDAQPHTIWTAERIELNLVPGSWVVDLRTWLRERARHMAGQTADAILRNVNPEAQEEHGSHTILTVDHLGNAAASPADADQWDLVVTPPTPVPTDPEPSEPDQPSLDEATPPNPVEVIPENDGQQPVPPTPTVEAQPYYEPAAHAGTSSAQIRPVSRAWNPSTSAAPAPHLDQAFPAPALPDTVRTVDHLASTDLFHTSWDGQPDVTPTRLPQCLVAVANVKGGVGKTTLAVTVTQALAHLAGHHDLALVEFNPAGTVRRRALVNGPGTVDDFIARALADPDFGRSQRDLDDIVTWQDAWAVIPSAASARENNSTDWREAMSADHVDVALAALRKTFRMLVVDTANDPRDPAWQELITRADHIMIPATWDPDVMALTTQMIKDMAAGISPDDLKRRIVWVTPPVKKRLWGTNRPARFHDSLVNDGWTVLTLPLDKHLAEGGVIRWDKLAAPTRKAATTIATTLVTP